MSINSWIKEALERQAAPEGERGLPVQRKTEAFA